MPFMTRLVIAAVILIAATVGTPPLALPAEAIAPSPTMESQTLPELSDPTLPVYKPPPKVKYPRARVGGVTRGSLGKDPMVVALVPDHVALTSHSKPTLYWYISQITSLPIIFTLLEDESVRPILEAPLAPPKQAGIQVIRLKEYGVELKEGVTYRWFVSVQRNPESPSQDIVTGGMIERVSFVEKLTLQLSAEEGLWYDAMMIVCDQIEASPEDKRLRRQRAALLVQIGLKEIAELDLNPTLKP
jgi:hypothetical protein